MKEENSGGSYDNERQQRLSSRISEDPSNLDHVIPVGSGAPGAGSELAGPTIKYSSLEAAAAQRKQRETEPANRESLKSRYSSDPCRVIGGGGIGGGMPAFSPLAEENDFPAVPAPPTPIDKGSFNLPEGKNKMQKHLQKMYMEKR